MAVSGIEDSMSELCAVLIALLVPAAAPVYAGLRREGIELFADHVHDFDSG
jgi:hypothetical protein